MRIGRLYFVLVFALLSVFAGAQAPTATIVMPTNIICTGASNTFSCVTSGTIASYSWSFTPKTGFTVNSPDNFGSSISLTFTTPITYSVTLVVTNSTGSFVTGGFITVSKTAHASYRATLSDAGFPTNLWLVNHSSNYTSILWDFGGVVPSQSTDMLLQPFTTPGNYTVSLIAYGSGGCNDTLDYAFTVDGASEVEMVNVFTPNDDGKNDVFRPRTKGLYELKVWVYNRWGVLMYNWNGVNGSWDGYTTSGVKCPDGVYFYVLEGKGFDQKDYKLKGNLSLIR